METLNPPKATADAPKIESEADIIKALEGLSADALLNPESVTPQDSGDNAAGGEASGGSNDGDKAPDAAGQVPDNDKAGQPAADKPADSATKPADDLSRERASLEREKLELDRQRLAFEKQRAELLPEAAKAKTSADDYERMAKEWAAEGKDNLAQAAMERATNLRRSAADAERQAKASKLQQDQMSVMREVVTQHPELKDTKSPLHLEVEKVMRQSPILASYPEGIRDAVEVAKLRLGSQQTEQLRKELAEVKQRLAEREKLLQPGTGAPSAAASTTENFDSLSSEERSKRIQRELRAAEARGETVWG